MARLKGTHEGTVPGEDVVVARVDPGQLTGFTIVLTSDRRTDELANGFTRRGAEVMLAPVMRIVPLEEDEELIAATRAVIENPPDDVVVTTAIGFRGWVEAADTVGLAPRLLQTLARARLLVRGPKARGAVRAAGLSEQYVAPTEMSAEVVEHLIDQGVTGRRVVVQLHGYTDEPLLERLTEAGAQVRTVPVYRWGASPAPEAVRRAIEAVAAASVDAVVFTSAPGSEAFLEAARAAGRYDEVVAALSSRVVAAAVGDVTANPLRAAGIEPLVPDRWRLGALIRSVAEHLATHQVQQVSTAGGVLHLRGRQVLLDDTELPLSPAPLAMLRVLADRPGEVVDRHRLLAALPGAADLHAVEMAVTRLRAALGRPGVVQTVVKRGYRLCVDNGTCG